MSRPTLRDVAREAGMSVTQVSRALNGHTDVAAETRERVREVASTLRYTPNLEARRLQDPNTRTGVLGLILSHETLRFSDPFFGDLLTSVTREAGEHGLQVNLSTPPDGANKLEPYDLAIRRKQVDGFILVRVSVDDPRIDFLLDASFPFVSFGRPGDRAGFGAVEIADDCMQPAVDHLAELGHRRIVCLTEGEHFAIGAARTRSFLAAMERNGLAASPASLIEGGFHEETGREVTRRLLQEPERPTAIVAVNDLLALGALEAASSLGMRVPDDLSLVGFDDIRAARQIQPTLTTIRQSASEVGVALIDALKPALTAGKPVHAECHVTSTLMLRESSGPPAAGDRNP